MPGWSGYFLSSGSRILMAFSRFAMLLWSNVSFRASA